MKMEEYLKNIEDNNVSYWLYVRENLKPNDYVKLNTGEIIRSMNVSPIKGNKVYYANGDDCWFDISAVRNFSSNIIDLIELGDLVRLFMEDDIDKEDTNIFEVIAITDDKKEIGVFTSDFEIEFVPKENLRGIVTKEQFESMEYKL